MSNGLNRSVGQDVVLFCSARFYNYQNPRLSCIIDSLTLLLNY